MRRFVASRLAVCVTIVALVIVFIFRIATQQAIATVDPAAIKVQGADTLGTPVQVVSVPAGTSGSQQTSVISSTTGGNQVNTATITAAGKTAYLAGFSATAGGSTAAIDVTITITGLNNGPLNFTFTFPAGALTAATPIAINFVPPIQASNSGVNIVVTLPAGGVGNTNASVSAWGFNQ